MDWIKLFITRLADCEVGEDVTNFYAYVTAANGLQRRNLALYLTQMLRLRPSRLLIGEAPGYRGCLQTGVPFTSEAIIHSGIPRWDLFGVQNGYQISGAKPQREATATIMWEILGVTKNLSDQI